MFATAAKDMSLYLMYGTGDTFTFEMYTVNTQKAVKFCIYTSYKF